MRHTIIHQFDPDRHVAGGVDGFIYDVLRLGDRDFQLIGVTSPGSSRRLGHVQQAQIGNGRSVGFMPVARLRSGDQSRRVPHSLRLLAGIARYRPSTTGQIVHFHRAEIAATAGRLLPQHHSAVFIHGGGRRDIEHRMETFWRFSPAAYEFMENQAIRRADVAYIMSAALAGDWDAAAHVHHGVNWFDGEHFFAQESRPDELVIGWAGRLEPQKDPLLAVEVMHQLKLAGRSFTGWMAGGGTLQAQVEREIRDRGLARQIELVRTLDAPTLGQRLRSSSAFLLTSRWEGIPRGVIEALASGVPVAATAVGDVPLLVGPTSGRLVTSRDPRELSEAVLDLASLDSPAAISASVRELEGRRVIPRLLDEVERFATAAAIRA
jgi:glycosyltransferase involved in cell wall biosynthesis